jgi:HK97 family phage portal protein
MTTVLDPLNRPIEIAQGRGDLRYSSVPSSWGDWGSSSVALAGSRRVSFANVFATQPMVAAAVMWLLAESVRVPLKLYRRTGDDSRERLRAEDHPLAAAIADPWDRGAACQLVMSLLGSLSVHGNSVMEIEQGARNVIRFIPADYRFACPIRPWRDVIAGWTLDEDAPDIKRTVSVDNVLHVAWWSPLGPLGVSPLQQLGTTLNIEDAAQRHQRSMLSNGARPPSAIVANAEFLGQSEPFQTQMMEQLREDITDLYSGPDNAGRPALLPPGLDWKPVGHTAVEAQLMEQRIVNRAEAGAIFRIQPGCFGYGSEKTDTNLDAQRTSSYVDGLAPPLILIEQCMNAQIVGALLREKDVYAEYDFAGILRGDRLKEVEALRESIASALMTPNEARATLNLPRAHVDGMDTWYLPRNNLVSVESPYDGVPTGSGSPLTE